MHSKVFVAGQRVAVSHGAASLAGEVAAVVEHPLYGPCVDVLVDGDARTRRFPADRVSQARAKKKDRRSAQSAGPEVARRETGGHR